MAGPRAIVVMGVTGCGKTEVGQALASRLGWPFIEGDALHPRENVERMARGEPLTDDLRAGWLDAIAALMALEIANNPGAVAGCSALKRIYRDRLRAEVGEDILFAHLAISPDVSKARVAARKGHFMPASLVDSQFAALEPPGAGETSVSLDGTAPIPEIVETVVASI